MSDLDVLLKSIPLYANLEEIERLKTGPNGIEKVAAQISDVIQTLAAKLLASAAAELAQPHVQGCVKDTARAEELRLSGNAFFSKGDYLQATKKFSESLRFLSTKNTSGCAKVLCNRALCMHKLGQHHFAVEDSTSAIECEPNNAKAYYRRAIAQKEFNQLEAARKDAERALQLLNHNSSNNSNSSTVEVEALLASLKITASPTEREEGDNVAAVDEKEFKKEEEEEEEGSVPLVWTTHTVPQGLFSTEEDHHSHEEEEDEDKEEEKIEIKDTTTAAPLPPSALLPCRLETIQCLLEDRVFSTCKDGLQVVETPEIGRYVAVVSRGGNKKTEKKEESKEEEHKNDDTNDVALVLPAGTDLFQDRPLAFVLSKRQRLQRCSNCCRELPLDGALYWPCQGCSLVVYCSRECAQKSAHNSSQHAAWGPECGRPWTALLPPEVVLAVRLAVQLTHEGSINNNNIPQSTGDDTNTTSTSQGIDSIVASSLETHFSKMAAEDIVHDATVACTAHAAYTLSLSHSQSTHNTTTTTISVGDVLRALCIVRINGIAIIPRAFGSQEDSIGLAVYPLVSMLTHACIPNVSVRFEGTTAIVRSLSPLCSAGTPLLHCYGPQAGEMTRDQRRKMLQGQYHFVCECTACTSEEERKKEREMVGLKCSTKDCIGGGMFPVFGGGGKEVVMIDAGILSKYDLECDAVGGGGTMSTIHNSSSTTCCTVCKATVSEEEWWTRIAPQLTSAAEAYATGCEMMLERNEEKKGRALLEESLIIRKALLHRNNQVLGATHSALSWGASAAEEGDGGGNTTVNKNAVKHCRASLEIAENLFPGKSTNVAFERLKLGTLLQQRGSNDGGSVAEGIGLVAVAMKVLELHYGTLDGDDEAMKKEKKT